MHFPISYCEQSICFFDLTTIFSNEWIILILTSNSLIDGGNLFCLPEHKYSFTASKIWFANSLCSHLGAKHDIFLWEMFNLEFMNVKPFYYLSSKKLEGWQKIKKGFQHSLILPQKEQAADEITTTLHKKPFVTGIVSRGDWPFQSLLSKTSLKFLFSKWWNDDSILKFLVNCFRDYFLDRDNLSV